MKKRSNALIKIYLSTAILTALVSGCVVHPAHQRHVVVAKPVSKTVIVKPTVMVKKHVVVKKVGIH